MRINIQFFKNFIIHFSVQRSCGHFLLDPRAKTPLTNVRSFTNPLLSPLLWQRWNDVGSANELLWLGAPIHNIPHPNTSHAVVL
ncbi:hypothetical protein Hanom_Chr03g00275791 [Helianthus anomalus]